MRDYHHPIKLLAMLLALIISIGSAFIQNNASAQQGYPPPDSPAGQPTSGPFKVYLPAVGRLPTPTKSYYMHISEPDFNPYSLGQIAAQEQQPALFYGPRPLIFILDWGQPCKKSSNPLVWGAYAHDNGNICHAVSEFDPLIRQFLDGYCTKQQSLFPGGSGQNCGYRYSSAAPAVTIAIGVNNCAGGSGCLNADINPSNAVTAGHGTAWAGLLNAVDSYLLSRGYAYQIRVAGALDIEGGWNTYASTKLWVDAFVAAAPALAFYNYGDSNSPEGYFSGNNDYIGPPLFPRDWSYDRIHYVAKRASAMTYALPQIYHTNGSDARKWQGVSKWATVNPNPSDPNVTKYGKIIFGELLTTSNRSFLQGASCAGICNTPAAAIYQMNQALNADGATANGLDVKLKSTDIYFWPR